MGLGQLLTSQPPVMLLSSPGQLTYIKNVMMLGESWGGGPTVTMGREKAGWRGHCRERNGASEWELSWEAEEQ